MAGKVSRERDPARGGSPASDERERVHRGRQRTGGPWDRFVRLLGRVDDAITRTFTAAAMAEDGTREMALEQLDPDDRAADETAGEEERGS